MGLEAREPQVSAAETRLRLLAPVLKLPARVDLGVQAARAARVGAVVHGPHSVLTRAVDPAQARAVDLATRAAQAARLLSSPRGRRRAEVLDRAVQVGQSLRKVPKCLLPGRVETRAAPTMKAAKASSRVLMVMKATKVTEATKALLGMRVISRAPTSTVAIRVASAVLLIRHTLAVAVMSPVPTMTVALTAASTAALPAIKRTSRARLSTAAMIKAAWVTAALTVVTLAATWVTLAEATWATWVTLAACIKMLMRVTRAAISPAVVREDALYFYHSHYCVKSLRCERFSFILLA